MICDDIYIYITYLLKQVRSMSLGLVYRPMPKLEMSGMTLKAWPSKHGWKVSKSHIYI